MMVDGLLAIALRSAPGREKKAIARAAARAYFPLGYVHFGLWYTFLAFHAVTGLFAVAGAPLAVSATVQAAASVVDALVVVWVAPDVLRSFCLNFTTSNMHYFGDVEAGNVVQQTQVLNHWIFAPFHLFCLNFGSTHAIHHFWVPEPSYVPQLSAPFAHSVMRKNGFRFNDLGSFTSANRWTPERESDRVSELPTHAVA